jgi:hypothetical protein
MTHLIIESCHSDFTSLSIQKVKAEELAFTLLVRPPTKNSKYEEDTRLTEAVANKTFLACRVRKVQAKDYDRSVL